MVKKEIRGKDATFSQHFKNARRFLQNNNIVEAKDEIEKALEIKPNDDRALNLLGMVYFKLEEYSKAADIFKQLTNRNPNVTTIYTNLGLAYIKMEQYENAIQTLKKALEFETDHVNTHNYLGLAYSKIGEYELALQEFKAINATKMIEKMEQKIKEAINKASLPADVKKELHEEEAKILSAQPEEIHHEETEKAEKKQEEKILEKKEEESKEKEKIAEKITPEPKVSAVEQKDVKEKEYPQKQEEEKPAETTSATPEVAFPSITRIAAENQIKIPELDGFQIINDKIFVLGVKNSIAHSKLNRMITYRGELSFSQEFKKFKGKETKAVFGSKDNPLMKIEGIGEVLSLTEDLKPVIFSLNEGHIFICENRMFAFHGKLEWENGRLQAEGTEDLNLVHLWGTGTIVFELKGKLMSFELNDNSPLSVDYNSLVGWYGKLIPHIKIVDVPNRSGNEKKVMIELKGEGILLIECITC